MTAECKEFALSPLPPSIKTDHIRRNSRTIRYEQQTTATVSKKLQDVETTTQHKLLEKDIIDTQKKGFYVCRLWQLLLTLNITIILITFILILLLVFLIGPLAPYQTYGQACQALSCNPAHGLVCNSKSICVCPSSDAYWSYNETGCRRCPNEWSIINGKCIFVSTFYLNWTEAFIYCNSLTAQLLTFSPIRPYSSLTLSHIKSLVSSNTNYFIGLSEEPNDSGNWYWVDGSLLSSSSMNLFCTNGSSNQFQTFFRINQHCAIYRMDSCLARYSCQRADMNSSIPEITNFLHDDTKQNLVVYELEYKKKDDPNEKICAKAKSQGLCPCRLWLIVFLINITIVALVLLLLLLLLIEVGPTPPYQTYDKSCGGSNCDSSKGLVCRDINKVKTCRCPSGNWFWYNNAQCRECPPNWTVAGNGTTCYFVSYTRLTFADANQWCLNSQSRLLEILDDKTFITLQSIRAFNFGFTDLYWIGLKETGPTKNIYRWITSEILISSSNYFCSGQPAHKYNYYFQEYDQCIGLYIQSNTSSCLRDSTCPNVSPFICELY